MYFPNDLWLIIKDNLFHNIRKHGKHLKNTKEIINFNKTVKSIPIKLIPRLGPRIVYSSVKDKSGRRYIKYIYHVHRHLKHIRSPARSYLDPIENITFYHPRSYQLIEFQLLPLDYDQRDEADEELRNDYWKEAQWIGTTNIPHYSDLV